MHTIKFFGKVTPIGTQMSITAPVKMIFNTPDLGFYLECTISVDNSGVVVDCRFDKLIPHYESIVHVHATIAARSLVDLIAFSLGCGITLIFDEIQNVKGERGTFAFHDPKLGELCTSVNQATFRKMIALIMNDSASYMALNDLICSMSTPLTSLINCARAVEGIRHVVSRPITEPKKQWPIMRDKLNISSPYIHRK